MNRRTALLLLCLLPVTAAAEPQRVPFALPGLSAVRVSLVLPEAVVVAGHAGSDAGDSVRARVDQGAPDSDYVHSLLVEVSDLEGTVLWSHDFGFNLSAAEGNTVTAAYQPGSRLLLLHYDGYKWDRDHKLLFIKSKAGSPSVREYDSAKRDLLPTLRRRRDFPNGYKYWIYPFRFVDRGVEFECVPIQDQDQHPGHPFAQDQPFYEVTATMNARGKMIPDHVKTTR